MSLSPESQISLFTVLSIHPKVPRSPQTRGPGEVRAPVDILILNQVAIQQLLMLLEYFYLIRFSNSLNSVNLLSIPTSYMCITWRIKYLSTCKDHVAMFSTDSRDLYSGDSNIEA